jgi:hypothetical protein
LAGLSLGENEPRDDNGLGGIAMSPRPICLAVALAACLGFAVAEEPAGSASAIASLTDPAKLATLISKPNLDYKKYPIKLTRP